MGVVFDKLLGKPLLHNHKTWYMVSPNGTIWDITIDNTGALVSTNRSTTNYRLLENNSIRLLENGDHRLTEA